MVELGVPTMARGRSAGWGYGPGLLVTETVTNGQTDVFLFLPAFRAATLRGPQFAQEEGRTGSEPAPRPGLGSGVWGPLRGPFPAGPWCGAGASRACWRLEVAGHLPRGWAACSHFGASGFLLGAGGSAEGSCKSFLFPVTKHRKLGDLKQ